MISHRSSTTREKQGIRCPAGCYSHSSKQCQHSQTPREQTVSTQKLEPLSPLSAVSPRVIDEEPRYKDENTASDWIPDDKVYYCGSSTEISENKEENVEDDNDVSYMKVNNTEGGEEGKSEHGTYPRRLPESSLIPQIDLSKTPCTWTPANGSIPPEQRIAIRDHLEERGYPVVAQLPNGYGVLCLRETYADVFVTTPSGNKNASEDHMLSSEDVSEIGDPTMAAYSNLQIIVCAAMFLGCLLALGFAV